MNLFAFSQKLYPPRLPSGFVLEDNVAPCSKELNRLLSKCNEETFPPNRLALAVEKSSFHLSIIEEGTGKLFGFVRATSDTGLNANLWNLVAEPCDKQSELLAVLIRSALDILRRDMPGCSVSVAAPMVAIKALKDQGFFLDPNGIRAMGLRMR